MSTCSKIWYDVLDSRTINIDLKNQKLLNQLLWDQLKQENNTEISDSLILNAAFIEFSERCADEYFEGKLINDEFLDFMIIENSFYFKEHIEFLNDVSLTLIRYNRKKIKSWLIEYELKNTRAVDIPRIKNQRKSREMLSYEEMLSYKDLIKQMQKQQQNSDRWFYFVIALILLGLLSILLFLFM